MFVERSEMINVQKLLSIQTHTHTHTHIQTETSVWTSKADYYYTVVQRGQHTFPPLCWTQLRGIMEWLSTSAA